MAEARARIGDEWRRRDRRFLEALDRLVWPVHSSPYRRLFEHAGIEAEDVGSLVRRLGLERALAVLRDEGVYVAHEEWLGARPVRRGSAEFAFGPRDFFNPRTTADFFAGTGGTRSGGIPVAVSFAHMHRAVDRHLLRASCWRLIGAPGAVWLPVMPSGAGISTILVLAGSGEPPERWFTPIATNLSELARRQRLANRFLPLAARASGVRLPRPEFAPPSDPAPVIAWCRGALERSGRARLSAYTSSAVRLAHAARDEGISLEGLFVSVLGEPLGEARAAIVRSSGATPMNVYGFAQKGNVAHACPACGDEDLHVLEHEIAVVQRRRTRPDGVEVDAFLWTSLSLDTPSVLINVESDDYGELGRDAEPCDCELGRLGIRWRVSGVRAMSKVVAGGMHVPGEVLARLAETVLPCLFGGTVGDYQFVEEGAEGEGRLTLRVSSRIGDVDESKVEEAVQAELRTTDATLLADELWASSGAFRVVRAEPALAPSGKILPLETLKGL